MTAVETLPQPAPTDERAQRDADVFVIFGITGDLGERR